jgi:hypothetical protein
MTGWDGMRWDGMDGSMGWDAIGLGSLNRVGMRASLYLEVRIGAVFDSSRIELF